MVTSGSNERDEGLGWGGVNVVGRWKSAFHFLGDQLWKLIIDALAC